MSNTSNLFGNMPGSSKFMDRLFKKADNIVWDLMTGRVGIQTADGIATLEGDGDDAQITINLMDQFGMGIPAFAQSTPISAVNVGDIIFFGAKDAPGWVIEKKGNVITTPGTAAKRGSKGVPAVAAVAPTVTVTSPKFVLMKVDGTRSTWTPPKVSMLGMDSGVMVLRSLMSMLPGGQAGLQGMQSMLMPMMMSGMMGDGDDGGMNMEAMIPMMLMGQQQAPLVQAADGTVVAAPNPMAQMMPMMAVMAMMKKMNNGGGNGNSNSGNGGKRSPFN
jgi:hypothetical protein